MKEEYLQLSQAAYLMQMTKPQFEKLVSSHKLDYAVCQRNRLIRASSLEGYVAGQRYRYRKARKYLEAENKSSFWTLEGQKFHNQGRCHDESMIEFLTVSQTAYLLGISRQAVHGLLKRGKMKKQYIELPGRRSSVFIRADEVERYVRHEEKKYERVQEFFQTKDSFEFWESHSADFEQNWSGVEKERNRRYYAKKKRKIQEGNGRTGQAGGTGAEGTEETKGAVPCGPGGCACS